MAGQNQHQGDDDQEFLKLSIIAIICTILIITLLKTQEHRLNALLGAATWIHILPFALIAEKVPAVLSIPFLGDWLFRLDLRALQFLEKGGYALMSPEARSSLLTAGGRSAFVIYAAPLLYIAVKGRQIRPDQKYRTLHSLESMIWIQSDNWHTTKIARHINPFKMDDINTPYLSQQARKQLSDSAGLPGQCLPRCSIHMKVGAWSRSLRPEEWLVANGLAFDAQRHDFMSASPEGVDMVSYEYRDMWETLDIDSVSEALSRQLRSPWRGAQELRPCHKALFAVMALFYNYDTHGGNALLNEISLIGDGIGFKRGQMDRAIMNEKGFMARIDSICTGKQGKALENTAIHHAWVETAFIIFLERARYNRGVLPAAAFTWLKQEDRLMWYILENVGSEAVIIEAAGAHAHARAEKQLEMKVYRPAVYQAARALIEDYLDVTPDRIVARKKKEQAQRSPGVQIRLIRDGAMKSESSAENAGEIA